MKPKVVVPAVINHENPVGFLTSDLWIPHPTRPDLWRIGGRLDDTVSGSFIFHCALSFDSVYRWYLVTERRSMDNS